MLEDAGISATAATASSTKATRTMTGLLIAFPAISIADRLVIPNQTHSRVGATSVALRPKCVEFSEESSRTADGNKFCRSAISSEEATPASTKAYATPKLKGDSHEGHHQLARGRGTAVRHQHRCCPSASHKSPDGLRGRDASRRLDALTVRPVSRMRG